MGIEEVAGYTTRLAILHPAEERSEHPPQTSHRAPNDSISRHAEQASSNFAATYERAGVGIAEVAADGTLLRVNAQLCALIGCSSEELLGRSIFDETYSDDIAADREQYRRQVAGEIDQYQIEKRIRRRADEYFWASITSSTVRDDEGRFLYAVRVQHDIT